MGILPVRTDRRDACPTIGAFHLAREMVVRRARAAASAPPAEAAILLVAFHLAIRADDFVALVHRAFEVGRCDPVVVEIDAHAVLEIDADLDGVVRVDAVAQEPFLLADGGQ